MKSPRRFGVVILLTVSSLLGSPSSFADAPYERHHVSYGEELRIVLERTIGILTLNSGGRKGTVLRTYLANGGQLTYNKTLKIKEETVPVSNFGYHPSVAGPYVDNYRYPIVAKSKGHLCIVYDATRNQQTWVDIEELESHFYTSIVMVDSLTTPDPSFVDIFCFTEDGKRRVYDAPRKDADFVVLSKDEHEHSLFEAIEQKDGFVKIGAPYYDADTRKETIRPVGWIRVRDDQGSLRIWIKYVDLW